MYKRVYYLLVIIILSINSLRIIKILSGALKLGRLPTITDSYSTPPIKVFSPFTETLILIGGNIFCPLLILFIIALAIKIKKSQKSNNRMLIFAISLFIFEILIRFLPSYAYVGFNI